MQSKLESAKEAIAQKDFKKLDDLWTEIIIDKQIQLSDILELTNELGKQGSSDQALFLLEVTTSHLESENEYRKLIEVYKNILQYRKENTSIRKELVNLYKKLYADSKYIAEYVNISGLDTNEPIYKALGKLEEFLRYDIGKYFYFERYGLGEIIDTNPVKKEIVINFEKKARHFLTIDVAKGLLIPINNTHFLHKKLKNIQELREMALSDPAGFMKFMLKSFGTALTASQIKIHLTDILEKEEIDRYWERARKKLEKDKNIKVSGKPAKTFLYMEFGVNQYEEAILAFEKATPQEKYLVAQDYARKMPAVFQQIMPKLVELGNKIYEQEPALALDILLLCNGLKLEANFSYTIDKILETTEPENIVKDLKDLDHQSMLLKIIKERKPDKWVDVLKALLLSTDNFKLLDEIAQNFKADPKKLSEIYYTIFSLPRQYPAQFQWLIKNMKDGSLNEYLNPAFIPKLIDSLEYIKGIKSTISQILSLETFDAIIKNGDDENIQRIIKSINSSSVLADYQKKDFLRIIEYYSPHLFAKDKDIDIIYTTERALNRKKEELQRLMTIEIAENKKEISRAREFGDLSDNFEYKAARERQDQLYQKLRMLEAELKKVKIINPSAIDTSRVTVGTKVTLSSLQNGDITSFTILGRWDTDLTKNIISNEAPVAKSLLGKACGEKLIVNNIKYEVMNIEAGL